MRVGIIGPESTGKSTLAEALAKEMKGIFVAEYARTYIGGLTRKYSLADVLHIAKKQIEEYEDTGKEKTYFFDTELIITKIWLLHKYHYCPEWISSYLDTHPMDKYLLCAPDIPFVLDPLRENPNIREELFGLYKLEIEKTKRPYTIIHGETKEHRLQHAIGFLTS